MTYFPLRKWSVNLAISLSRPTDSILVKHDKKDFIYKMSAAKAKQP